MDNKQVEFCTCKESSGVYSEVDEWGYWLRCSDCDKVIEDSYTYHNEPDPSDLY